MRFILYLATNKINGKKYVGATGRSLKKRMIEHESHAHKNANNGYFYKAINKYGFASFEFKVISTHNSKDEMFDAEIEYIANHSPEYNCTLGGEGRLGGAMSGEAIEKIRQIHIGNKYRLGKTHTKEVRNVLKGHGVKNIGIFKKYMHLGPQKSSKSVMCLDDLMVFPSASDAARRYNVARSAVIELCNGQRGRKTVGGFRFSYYEAQ